MLEAGLQDRRSRLRFRVVSLALACALACGGCRRGAEPQPGRPWLALQPADGAGDGPLDGLPALDLRGLNERVAGEGGFIAARDGKLVHARTGAPVRFWGVNGPPRGLAGEALRRWAREQARLGVNLVRLHDACFDERGELDPPKVARAGEVVEALAAEGIYTALSIYYPLWLKPAPGSSWLAGYDGQSHPFAALMFNAAFQERYRAWWRALLLTPSPRTGRRLIDQPALAILELQNEDSLLFPTAQLLPGPQRQLLEQRFGAWLTARHGSVEAALRAWGAPAQPGDAAAAGRLALRPHWQLLRERTRRDLETVRFLVETQASFYRETRAFLRGLGVRALVVTSNWKTADDRVLGPLEKLTATEGDLIDRHAYFGAALEGEAASWSLRPGQTFADRSALRFDGGAGKERDLDSPVMDPRYAGLPSMVSEVSWERPSRFRAEGPLFLAAYAALQGTDAVVQFRSENPGWSTRNRGVATPWPLDSPGQLGQFPAAALLYRQGLVATAGAVARLRLDPERLLELEGMPLSPDGRLDPLLHLAGRVEVEFGPGPTAASADPGAARIDQTARTVVSATGQLRLDYGAGLLIIDAPGAQGAVGALRSGGDITTADLRIGSPLETGAVVAVSLDGRPLRTSSRILLQVMSEERASGFAATPTWGGRQRLLEPGHDPWEIRPIEGTVALLRPDAASLRVTALDPGGRALQPAGDASQVRLLPGVLAYLIELTGP